MFPTNPRLRPKIRKFVQASNKTNIMPRVSVTLAPELITKPAARPRYSIFIKSTPEPEEAGDDHRLPGFNKELLERYHSSFSNSHVSSMQRRRSDSLELESVSNSESEPSSSDSEESVASV